jgi:hypothetical protein
MERFRSSYQTATTNTGAGATEETKQKLENDKIVYPSPLLLTDGSRSSQAVLRKGKNTSSLP